VSFVGQFDRLPTDALWSRSRDASAAEVSAALDRRDPGLADLASLLSPTAAGQLEPLSQGKPGTRDGELLLELKPTPKLIARLREWFPAALLVGWKYEVDGDRDAALGQGRAQISENQTDGCIVNGPAFGKGFGWLAGNGQAEHLADQSELFEHLTGLAK